MSFGWIDAGEYSLNTLLLMDTWLVRYISGKTDAGFTRRLGIGLAANPAVLWYFAARCPDMAERLRGLADAAPRGLSPGEVREAETWLLDALDWAVVYVYPELMDELPYIRLWDAERLLSIADFTGREVLDIGSGTGRLAIAAALRAKWVFASEPVDRLREYLREKLKRLGIRNVYVVDGSIEDLPFPDASFDIVMSGHVVGDDYKGEDRSMSRVTRPGGWIIDCPGEDTGKHPNGPRSEMVALGYQYAHYVSKTGSDVYRYWRRKGE